MFSPQEKFQNRILLCKISKREETTLNAKVYKCSTARMQFEYATGLKESNRKLNYVLASEFFC